jgi:glutathione peroxidase
MIKIAIAFGILVSATLLMKKKDMSYRQSILKTLYPMIMWSSHSSGAKQVLSNQQLVVAPVSFYTLHAKAIDGSNLDLTAYKGKKIMIVNTASDCGFTGQYEALEKLHQQYKNELVVIGLSLIHISEPTRQP